MQCPDCHEPMNEELVFSGEMDLVELILTCPKCTCAFFGTLYKVENTK